MVLCTQFQSFKSKAVIVFTVWQLLSASVWQNPWLRCHLCARSTPYWRQGCSVDCSYLGLAWGPQEFSICDGDIDSDVAGNITSPCRDKGIQVRLLFFFFSCLLSCSRVMRDGNVRIMSHFTVLRSDPLSAACGRLSLNWWFSGFASGTGWKAHNGNRHRFKVRQALALMPSINTRLFNLMCALSSLAAHIIGAQNACVWAR